MTLKVMRDNFHYLLKYEHKVKVFKCLSDGGYRIGDSSVGGSD